jgi:hypothetical protein
MQDFRREIVRDLRWSFFGPDFSDTPEEKQMFEMVDSRKSDPSGLFITGILSPMLLLNEDEDSQDDSPFSKTGNSDSSFGFTFCVPKNENGLLEIGGELSTYKRGKNSEGKSVFIREEKEFKFRLSGQELLNLKRNYYDVIEFGPQSDKIQMAITKRLDMHNDEGEIYTLSIIHLGKEHSSNRSWDRTAFHVSIYASTNASFVSLPEVLNELTEDKRKSSLLYRDVKRYAIGHGCGTQLNENVIRSTFFPSVEVPVFTHKDLDSKALDMSYWMNDNVQLNLLEDIPNDYLNWINLNIEKTQGLNHSQLEVLHNNKASSFKVVERIKKGIERLKSDPNALLAFQYMNRAMLMQQVRSKTEMVPFKKTTNGFKHDSVEDWDIDDRGTWPVENQARFGKWRLFQMAFILMSLDDVCSDKKDDNLDLIWFPTGGGKTEAYLGLSGFLLLYERLISDDHSGVKIIMRYTLRLLTAQQFERAACLIVALEDIRLLIPEMLGQKEFSIGLWVGGDVTFNKHGVSTNAPIKKIQTSNQWFDALSQMKSQSWSWILQKCPRCSREFGLKWSDSKKYIYGVERNEERTKVYFSCDCSSNRNKSLPVYVVDEDVYSELPSIVIGTVDKFARLSWNPSSAKIIGVQAKGSGNHSKLSLIIQDELHLLDGPLGTIAGLYEAAIDFLISRTGAKPKRIGSSATLAMAREQCRDLYGVPLESVNVFPPALLDWNDNYFSYADTNSSGRQYVGLYANGSPSNKTTQYRLFSSLLQSGGELYEKYKDDAEGYSTLVNYFNSTKDMGHALSLMGDDVPRELVQLRSRFNYTSDRWKKVDINDGLVQLHGNVKSDVVQKDMQRLTIKYEQSKHVHTVLATNMISVGLDVPRLALMSIIHQPKSMSEYIQASSRVGRGKTPGIVFVMLSSLRMRDRSHLEDFVVTHQKMYSLVEPSSLTPYSLSSLERALPGVLIAIFRNDPQYGSREAIRGIADELYDTVKEFFLKRIRLIDPLELDNFIQNYRLFCRLWNSGAYRVFGDEMKINKANRPLMVPFLTPTPGWDPIPFQVLQAMRNVDSNIELKQISNGR